MTIFHGFFGHFLVLHTTSLGILGDPLWHRAWEEQDAGDGVGRHQLQQLVVEAQDVAEGPAAGQADPWGKSVVGNLLENLWEHFWRNGNIELCVKGYGNFRVPKWRYCTM